MNIKKCLFFILFFLFFLARLSADPLIENAVSHYFNGEPEIALFKLQLLDNSSASAVVHEYQARCYWEFIKKMMAVSSTKQAEKVELLSELDKKLFEKLENYFFENIDRAILLSQVEFEKENTPQSALNLAMALSTKAGYLIQMHGGKRAGEAAIILDEAIIKINFCLSDTPPFCLAYLPLGATQYFMTKEITGKRWLGYVLFARFKVPTLYKTINFDKDEAIQFVETASRCEGPEIRKTEALFILQQFLMDYEENDKRRQQYSIKALPILEELTKKFPKNRKLRDNLTLVYFHLKNKNR